MYRQMIAITDPVIAIHTTEIAAGTLASKDPKCSLAKRKPKAEDFMDVSIAIVRDDTSENPMYLGNCSMDLFPSVVFTKHNNEKHTHTDNRTEENHTR